MKRLLPTFAWTAVLTHLVGFAVTGAFLPGAWPRLLVLVLVLVFAPCVALAIAVITGAILDDPTGARGG